MMSELTCISLAVTKQLTRINSREEGFIFSSQVEMIQSTMMKKDVTPAVTKQRCGEAESGYRISPSAPTTYQLSPPKGTPTLLKQQQQLGKKGLSSQASGARFKP
jgi:hypothetical protein